MTLRIGSLFSGYGGLELGIQAALGGEVAWHVEFDDAPSRILEHHWPGVPNYGDVTKVDWSAVEPIDILAGGFPCQDVSLAGLRRGLKTGTRSGLWSEFARAIDALRPTLVVIENVRGLLSAESTGSMEPDPWDLGDGDPRPTLRAIGAVLGDLADLGYDAEWRGLRAADAGAPHGRFRVFILAYPNGRGYGQQQDAGGVGRVDGGDAGTPQGRERARSESVDRGSEDVPDAASARRCAGQDAGASRGDEGEGTRGLESQRGSSERTLPTTIRDTDDRHGDGGEREERGQAVGGVATRWSSRTAVPNAGSDGLGVGGTSLDVYRAIASRNLTHRRDSRVDVVPDSDHPGRSEQRRAVSGSEEHPPLNSIVDALSNAGRERGNESHDNSGQRGEGVDRASVADERSSRSRHTEWGEYAAAVERWETATGRIAPPPVEPSPTYLAMRARRLAGRDTRPVGMRGSLRKTVVLSPAFVEWMMGLEPGHVTLANLTRNQQLKALGNGVVPQQAELAIRYLLGAHHE